jgi:hypothetical protein
MNAERPATIMTVDFLGAQGAVANLSPGSAHTTVPAGPHITALIASIDLRRANPAPLYYQLAQGVERMIADGALSSGDRLPPVGKIALSLRLNAGTVRTSWAYLEKKGTIRRAYKGAYVM